MGLHVANSAKFRPKVCMEVSFVCARFHATVDEVTSTTTRETSQGSFAPDEHFGDRLRATRLKKGWRQVDLARAAKMTESGFRSIQDWETGEATPRIGGKINAVAAALGVSLGWLMWGEED